MRFTNAIVRPPAPNFAAGITSATEGTPNVPKAIEQHESYSEALRHCGLQLCRAAADDRFPDGTFVEDTAVIAAEMAILTRPGAPSRRGEVASVAAILTRLELSVHEIRSPGTVDGGDVCQAERHFFIGLSNRTNEAGASQFAAIVRANGYTCSIIDVRSQPLLHLKSGIAYLGENRLLCAPGVPASAELQRHELIHVAADEAYAANCVRVNRHVLVAAGYPKTLALIRSLGYVPIALDMSEFRKMDGGLSCLSLRF